jgi:glycosyltransferase involved in cell wall biosynthesis
MNIRVLSCIEDSMERDSGASVRIYNLVRNLSSRGNSVSVIMPGKENMHKSIDGVEVFFIKGFVPNEVLKILAKIIGVTRPTSLYFYDFLFILRLWKLTQEADIVQFEGTSGLLALLFRRFFKKRVVVDVHDAFQALRLRHTSLLRRMLETSVNRLDYGNSDLLLTVSESEKKYLTSTGFKKQKTLVVPNGVELKSSAKSGERTDFQKKYGLEGFRVVTFVGNLDYLPNREAIYALSASIAPRVMVEIKNVKFLVVGKGQHMMELPGLTFTGFVKDVSDILSISDVAVAPLFNGSGTRLKILEYFSCGLPVVSTSVGAEGIEVKDGVNILIEDDLERFSLRIIELLKNDQLSTALGEAARVLVASTYDWSQITTKLETAMNSIIS